MLAFVLAAGAALAGCGTGSRPDGGVELGRTGLDRPPFAPTARSRITGVGADRLLLLDGVRVATYDFRDSRWRRHPDAPFTLPAAVTHLGDTVVLIEWRCRKDCDQDSGTTAGFTGATLDLAGGDARWREARLDIPPSSQVGSDFLPYGQLGDEQILGQSGLLAIDRALRVRALPDPPTALPERYDRYQACVTADGRILWLVGNPAAPPEPPGLSPTFGAAGSARIVELGADGQWTEVAGSSTRGVGVGASGFDRELPHTACTPDGPLAASDGATARWSAGRWHITPRGPSGMIFGGAFTTSGVVVASGGAGGIQVWKDGSWGVLPLRPDAPPGSSIAGYAVVGDRIVVLDAPPVGAGTFTQPSP